MNPKINTLKDLEYFGAFTYCCDIVKKWEELKPDNEELKELSRSLAVVFFYVNTIQSERILYDKYMSDSKSEKNRAIMRARKSESEIDELKAEIQRLKNISGL